MPPASLTLSLNAPSVQVPPQNEADLSGSSAPPDLKSLCGSRVLRRLAHFTTPTSKGQEFGLWNSMAGPSH
jgi:hypothetical protein